MYIGLGIFLGCFFLGTVFLYLKTADRWNWEKIAKRTLLIAVILVVGGVLIAVGMFGYKRWEQRPQVVTSLRGISIGDKLSDAVFKRGSFEKQGKAVDVVSKYQDEEKYTQKNENLSITVRGGVVIQVVYRCENGDVQADETKTSPKNGDIISWEDVVGVTINGIRCHDSGDQIKQLFGKMVRVLCRKKDGEHSQFVRVYDVVEYGTRYYLLQNKVSAFIIADKKELESFVGLNWGECK